MRMIRNYKNKYSNVSPSMSSSSNMIHFFPHSFSLFQHKNHFSLDPLLYFPISVTTLRRGETHDPVHCTFINLMKLPNEKVKNAGEKK